METMTFVDVVSFNYKDIKTLFQNRSIKRHLMFDEDAFNDAFIKCAEHFENELISYDTAIKYFWTAYIHIVLNHKIHDAHSTGYSDIYDCEDIIYNIDIDYIYNAIINDVKNKFGDEGVNVLFSYLNKQPISDKNMAKRICKYIKIKYKELVIDTLCK